MTEVVDSEARGKAELALRAISSHETHCGERWQEARKAADRTNEALVTGFRQADESTRRLHQRIDRIIWAVAIGAVGLLANAMVLLVAK